MIKPQSAGRSIHFLELAPQRGWDEWRARLQILQDDPFFYTQHSVNINGQYWFFYCLGSPPDGARNASQYQLDPAGVQQCRSLEVPVTQNDGTVTMSPLHDADGGGRSMFHLYVWDWDSKSVKIIRHRMDGSLHAALYELWQENGSLTGYDIVLRCAPQGNLFKYVVYPCPPTRTHGDFQAEAMPIIQEQMANREPGSVWAAYNPAVTYELLKERIAQAISGQQGTPEEPAVVEIPTLAPVQLTTAPAEATATEVDFEAGTTPPPSRFDPDALPKVPLDLDGLFGR